MALSALIQWEIRPATGSADNGGGFKAGATGTDRSQQPSAQVVINNTTITCTTPGANSNTLTFTAGYTPTGADVGNVVAITAGTNINAGIYEITGFTASTWTVTGSGNLTTAGGAGSAITGNMGGARSGFSNGTTALQTKLIAAQKVWVKAEVGWNESVAVTANVMIEGYKTTRGDAPLLWDRPINDKGGTNAGHCLSNTAAGTKVLHLILAGSSDLNGFNTTNVATLINVRSTRNATHGIARSGGLSPIVTCIDCEADGNGGNGFDRVDPFGCSSHHNALGANVCNQQINSILAFNSVGVYYGASSINAIVGCTVHGNTTNGIEGATPTAPIVGNNITNNSTDGLTANADPTGGWMVDYNNFSGNGTDRAGGIAAGVHDTVQAPGYGDVSTLALTDLVIDGADSTKVSSAAHPFTSADVYRYLSITSGVGFTVQKLYITSVVGNDAVLEKSAGTVGSTGGNATKYGLNFSPGPNVLGIGFPQKWGDPVNTGYPDSGAVQSQSGVVSGGPVYALRG